MSATLRPPGEIFSQGSMHEKVDGVFLPLSVRQNRVEDIYVQFLEWLVRADTSGARARSADQAADYLLDQIRARPESFSLPTTEGKRRLLREWARLELVIEPRQSNRSADEMVSVLPLHVAVAAHFKPPSNPPAYGRVLCELLSLTDGGRQFALLDELSDYLSDAGGDPVASLIEAALKMTEECEPKYKGLADLNPPLIVAETHALQMQSQVRNLLLYKRGVSRSVFLSWLYASFSFFLATYFSRMAAAAQRFSVWLSQLADEGVAEPWAADWNENSLRPGIPFGRKDSEHSRLMKRYPGYSSAYILVRRAVCESEISGPESLAASLLELGSVELTQFFQKACELYPVRDEAAARSSRSRRSGSRLPETDKRLMLAASKGSGSFGSLQALNFESMSRSSNSILEWQFFATLAKSATYGFASPRVSGDELEFRPSQALLSALVHSHCAAEPRATLSSLVTYLEELSWEFDGPGRSALESQLQGLGLLDELADASEAKYLRPYYAVR